MKPDGSYNFKDSYVKNNVIYSDSHQDWFPIMVKQQGPILIAQFTRKVKLCDLNEDFDIVEGSPRVLAALGLSSFNSNLKDAIFIHSIRSVNLINTINEKIMLKNDEIQIADFRVNVSFNFLLFIIYIFSFLL